ncbi:hypothetical protein Taro_005633 [Colocasia esculenta]|uniref:Uncharacterized protein n=1 Tax=Colocasia esculenta TaxID=4460 RepID=A0A843TSX6_COLES|nr:hypothetical protein [Colocasia esculenta]
MACAHHSCPVLSDSTGFSSLPEKGPVDRGSVDTRDLPGTPSGLSWDSVSTQVQVVSTLVALTDKNI